MKTKDIADMTLSEKVPYSKDYHKRNKRLKEKSILEASQQPKRRPSTPEGYINPLTLKIYKTCKSIKTLKSLSN